MIFNILNIDFYIVDTLIDIVSHDTSDKCGRKDIDTHQAPSKSKEEGRLIRMNPRTSL